MHKIYCTRISDKQTVEIDIDTTENWKELYTTLSWTPFDSDTTQEIKAEDTDEELEDLWHSYINATGKDVPVRYKNNKERLKNKIGIS